MSTDWLAIAKDMAEKARAKVAEDSKRLEDLSKQRGAVYSPSDASVSR
jgi:hypothetical protein